ncbi:hypothetical protein D3C87_1265020 [compost metagenome]
MSPFFKTLATAVDARLKGSRSGVLDIVTGVGTVMIKKSQDRMSSSSEEKNIDVFERSLSATSRVRSTPLLSSAILSVLISKPTTVCFFANSIASGSPT